MSFDQLHLLLQEMFSPINNTNHVPEPDVLWQAYNSEIVSLLASSTVRDEFVSLGGGIWLPRSFEATRALGQLRQRFSPSDVGRSLIGRIRAEAIVRKRPT